jgi:23S rRNA pseudouridine1911/1915/1917 synthase
VGGAWGAPASAGHVAGSGTRSAPGGDLGLTRQFLHAARLAFAHPVTGEPVDVSSPLPTDLADVLDRLDAGNL